MPKLKRTARNHLLLRAARAARVLAL
jgi:hypothetical protein